VHVLFQTKSEKKKHQEEDGSLKALGSQGSLDICPRSVKRALPRRPNTDAAIGLPTLTTSLTFTASTNLAKASCRPSWGLEIWMQCIGMAAEEKKMAKQNKGKCAHIPCLCDVADGEEYCGQICRDAGSEDVEIACQCDHLACPLPVQQFAPGRAAGLAS
jgi:hypothetical protein